MDYTPARIYAGERIRCVMVCYEFGVYFIYRSVLSVADLTKKTKPKNKDDMQALSEGYSAALDVLRAIACGTGGD